MIPRFLKRAMGYICRALTDIGNTGRRPGWGVICSDFMVPWHFQPQILNRTTPKLKTSVYQRIQSME